jgi:phasin family protein
MAAAQDAKTKFDPFNAAGAKAFKDSFDKSMSALTEMNAHSKKNFEALVASATAAAKGAEAVGARAVAYSRKSLEDQVTAAKAFAGAKSVQEAVELQTTYAKSAFEGYVAEITKISETVAGSVKETMAPINERVTAFVEQVQAGR